MNQPIEQSLKSYLRKFSQASLVQIIIRGNQEGIFDIPEEKILLHIKDLPDFIEKEAKKSSPLRFGANYNAIAAIDRILDGAISEDSIDFLDSEDKSILVFMLMRLSNEYERPYTLSDDIMQCSDMVSLKIKLRTYIFSMNEDPEEIQYFITTLKNGYFLSKKNFNFKWLKNENKEQAKWAAEYISENKLILEEYDNLPLNLITEKNYIPIVEGIFHSLCFYEREQAKLYERFKRAWSQHKFRKKAENDNKVNVSFLMKDETKKRLQEVADYHKTSMIDVIERLVNSSWEAFNEGDDSL
ncbi:hypothetical protein [Vibrio parahaemolyticus]|uniref:hypothetical protein n=1 Tax=Vibrio parahaemolyticus TaxID=670 RepID=UPI00111F0A77|nr:hypothetical protein [Vibrio parahaemolyticus]MCZ6385245.1 hypothetical protein [Vibrio parahaemolyticus]MDF4862341.1 hypothetical protein [Vibrio parahaemolyticus]MRD97058.1 hypothetical protein [Vibrio parahaemolyticus]QNE56884.1 hypothetical protein H5404_13475 [Vibrio parahaemolyticus]HBC0000849.1 hypothetical protein [Vibrio parahaemolyticus]